MSNSNNRVRSGADVDLGTLLTILWSRRRWILSSVAVFAAIFAIVAFSTTPVYRATVVIVPANTELNGGLSSTLGQLGGLASLAGINLGSGGSAPEESLAVLRSRSFTEAFIRDQQLMPKLFPEGRNVVAAAVFGDRKPPTLSDAYGYFDRSVRSVSQDRTTGLISVDIDWTDPEDAARWANALVGQLNAEMRRRALASVSASLDYLQKALTTTTVIDTREAITRLMERQINQGMLATVTEEYAFRVVDQAMAPDADDPFKPKKAVLLLLGLGLGAFLGCMVALVVPRKGESGA